MRMCVSMFCVHVFKIMYVHALVNTDVAKSRKLAKINKYVNANIFQIIIFVNSYSQTHNMFF